MVEHYGIVCKSTRLVISNPLVESSSSHSKGTNHHEITGLQHTIYFGGCVPMPMQHQVICKTIFLINLQIHKPIFECKENIPHNLSQHQAHNFHILQSYFNLFLFLSIIVAFIMMMIIIIFISPRANHDD